ncbi:XRE family transcriptional regulator [Weissella cibaria]|uniref:XRE family transcriptional regulator n=1 Tax=Weissella cibaria TaxID=137591 RepID=UPI0034E87E75
MALGNKEIMAENIQYYLAKNAKAPIDMVRDLEFKQTTVYDWINARTYPRIDKIEMMANYFGIDKSDLVEKRNTNEMHSNKKDDKTVDLEQDTTILALDGIELSDDYKQFIIDQVRSLRKLRGDDE